jgi:hypothetical protein
LGGFDEVPCLVARVVVVNRRNFALEWTGKRFLETLDLVVV